MFARRWTFPQKVVTTWRWSIFIRTLLSSLCRTSKQKNWANTWTMVRWVFYRRHYHEQQVDGTWDSGDGDVMLRHEKDRTLGLFRGLCGRRVPKQKDELRIRSESLREMAIHPKLDASSESCNVQIRQLSSPALLGDDSSLVLNWRRRPEQPLPTNPSRVNRPRQRDQQLRRVCLDEYIEPLAMRKIGPLARRSYSWHRSQSVRSKQPLAAGDMMIPDGHSILSSVGSNRSSETRSPKAHRLKSLYSLKRDDDRVEIKKIQKAIETEVQLPMNSIFVSKSPATLASAPALVQSGSSFMTSETDDDTYNITLIPDVVVHHWNASVASGDNDTTTTSVQLIANVDDAWYDANEMDLRYDVDGSATNECTSTTSSTMSACKNDDEQEANQVNGFCSSFSLQQIVQLLSASCYNKGRISTWYTDGREFSRSYFMLVSTDIFNKKQVYSLQFLALSSWL